MICGIKTLRRLERKTNKYWKNSINIKLYTIE